MNTLRWKYCFLLALLCYFGTALAQSDLELKTAQLLSSPITWVKQYDGIIDGVHAANLCLAFDGINCKGYMTYLSSDIEYLLEGTLQNDKLVLLEKYKDLPSGYIKGKYNLDEVELEWKSIDESESYKAYFTSNDTQKANVPDALLFKGYLDEQSVNLTLQTYGQMGTGNLVFDEQKVEKLYAQFPNQGEIKIDNLTSGYSLRLVNTKEKKFEASFILPGSVMASQLNLEQIANLNSDQQEYISHSSKVEILLPNLDDNFNNQINSLTENWQLEIEKYKNVDSMVRFEHAARLWFELHTYNEEYLSGMLYYNATWNKEMKSKTFTYNRKENKMMDLAPFLKGSAKWERAVKERMLAGKELNNPVEEDHYKKWIDRVVLMDPILCDGGLEFLTESNSVFGQARTFISWEALSPLVISPSKLNKLRKIK